VQGSIRAPKKNTVIKTEGQINKQTERERERQTDRQTEEGQLA